MESPRFLARDGVELAYHEGGSGRPLILLHGFMESGLRGLEPWARMFIEQGRQVVLPDLRGHGDSAKPHGAESYPPDVLADDGLALLDHLGLGDGDYDLGGYSLGARIVVRMLVRGARPGRAIVAGQGLERVTGPQGDASRRILASLAEGAGFVPGSREARLAQWAQDVGADPVALGLVIDSLVPTSEDEVRRITTPTLVAIGDADERADADELAALLPNSRFVRVPGSHRSAPRAPELAAAMSAFLAGE
jgi:pimeloyl-ACP methyl ester carboxylesterase